MSGISGDYSALRHMQRQFQKLATPEAKRLLVRDIAEEYRNFMLDCFRASHGPYGEAWAPLKFRTSSGAGAGKQKPLADTGIMKGAVTPRNITATGFRVAVGREYATTHQYGAVIVPKNAKALRFRGVDYHSTVAKSGRKRTRRIYGNWIFRKRVVIPARPFAPLDGIPPDLDSRVQEASQDFMRDFFGR